MNLSFDTITKPITDVVGQLSSIGTNVMSLSDSITKDVLKNIPIPDLSNLPKPDDITKLLGMLTNIGGDLASLIGELPKSTVIITDLLEILKDIKLDKVVEYIQDPSKCDLVVCKLINDILEILDVDNCDKQACKIFREVRDAILAGNISGCSLEACNWIREGIELIQDPFNCKLELCNTIRALLNFEEIMNTVQGIASQALETVKRPIIIGLSIIGIVILSILLMLLYLVFK